MYQNKDSPGIHSQENIFGLEFAGVTFLTFLTLVISNAIFLAISIVTARTLGPAGKGVLTVIILYPTLLYTLGHLSVYRALTVHMAEKKFPHSDFPGSVLVFVIAVSLLLISGFAIAFFSLNKYFIQNVGFHIILLALGIIPCSILTSAFNSILQANNRMKEFNLSTVIQSGLILLFIIITLIIFKSGVNGAVFSYFVANLLTMACAVYFVRKIIPENWKFNLNLLKTLMGDGIKLHIGIIASFIFLRIDMLMLEHYRRASSVGYYSIAVSIADLLILVPLAVQHVFYSRVPDMIKDKKDMAQKTVFVYKHTLFISIAAALFLAVLTRPIIKIAYGKEFLPSFVPFLILLPGAFYLWQNNILAASLIGMKRILPVSLIAASGSVINVVLNLIFIPRYDANGAALASFITYLIVGTFYVFLFLRVSRLKFKEFLSKLAVTKEDRILYKTIFAKILKR